MNTFSFRLPALLIALFSSSTYAYDIGHLYAGTDFHISNESEVSSLDNNINDTSDIGYSAHLGYLFNTHKLVKLGIEAEYRQFGQTNYSHLLIHKGSATFVNLKPKFVNSDTQLYSAVLLGVGIVESEFQTYERTTSNSSTGYQFGVEVGYDFTSGFSAYLGYKALKTDKESIELATSGAYAGFGYSF